MDDLDKQRLKAVEAMTEGQRKPLWLDICKYLEGRPRRASYEPYKIGGPHRFLIQSRKLKPERDKYIFYSAGWGWRLRKAWKDNFEL